MFRHDLASTLAGHQNPLTLRRYGNVIMIKSRYDLTFSGLGTPTIKIIAFTDTSFLGGNPIVTSAYLPPNDTVTSCSINATFVSGVATISNQVLWGSAHHDNLEFLFLPASPVADVRILTLNFTWMWTVDP